MGNNRDSGFAVGFISSPHPHSNAHVKTLEELDEVEEVYLCGLEGEDLNGLAAETSKLAGTTGSVAEMVSHPGIDAVVVSVRNDLCPGVLDAAIEAGKPALFEKPGALTAAELRRLAGKAASAGVTVGAMYTNRGSPIMREVKKARQDGALGRVMNVEARFVTSQVRYRDTDHWLFKKSLAGSGILSWLGCHHIDVLCFLLDDRVVEVSAMAGALNPEQMEVEDTACVVLRFASGVIGALTVGYLLAGSPEGYHGGRYDMFLGLRGTDGYVSIPLSDGNYYTIHSIAPGLEAAGIQERRFTPPDSPAYIGKTGEEFVASFLRASRSGAPADAPIEAAVHVLEVVEAALESSATGRAVKVG